MSPADGFQIRRMKPTLEMMVAVTLLAGLVVAGLWLFQRRLIYFPVSEVPAVSTNLPGAQVMQITTDDGLTLTGWFISPPNPTAAVLVLNGNAGNRADRARLANGLVDRGYEVLVFDYRGYGGNEGSPSEEGLALDAAAAAAALAEVATSDRLIFLGESLGASVAARLSVEAPPTALVLRSPFPSLAAVGSVHYPFLPTRLLLRDRYDTLDAVDLIEVPILVIAGSADSIVPTRLSRLVYEAAADAYWAVIENTDHNDPALSSGEPLLDAIDQFLDEELLPSTGRPAGAVPTPSRRTMAPWNTERSVAAACR